jgi:hypothetical protein
MTGKTRVWKIGDTWNKLAYAYYGDSREFRTLVDLNPSYDIRVFPAQGVPIYVEGSQGSQGKSPVGNSVGSPGTLSQLSTALNLGGSNPLVENEQVAAAIFPWDNFEDYAARLSQYTAFSLLERDRVNGYSLDSPEAL